MTVTKLVEFAHKTGRGTCFVEYWGESLDHITRVQAAAVTWSHAQRTKSGGAVRHKKGGISGESATGGKSTRVSYCSIAGCDLKGRRLSPVDVRDGGGIILSSTPPGPKRVSVRALETLTHVKYQATRNGPLLTSAQKVAAYRTQSQREILNDDVMSSLYRVHPFGGGLVSIFANVADNAFVGVGVTVLPGAKISTRVVLEDQCLVAASVNGYARVSDQAFVHFGARLQDHAEVGGQAWIDQCVWVGGKVSVGGQMNIVTDDTGHLRLGGFGNISGAFTIVGGGQLMTGSTTYAYPEQIRALVRSTIPRP
jgi:hypothetical protein